MLTFPAFSKWAIAPKMVIQAARYARKADVIMLNSLYSFPVLLGYLLARRYNKPYCLWPHGVLAPFQRRVSAGKKRVYGWLVAQRILNHASAIVFTSQGEREETRSLGLTASSVIIPLGFDTAPYEHLPQRGAFRAQYLQGHSGPVVLFLSRLNAKKGLDVLIQAFAQVVEHLPDARLAIVGNSDPPAFESKVQTWLRHYGLAKNTAMTGPLTGKSKLQAFADADVFVLPSHEENFGVAVFEAMASRLPVVVSDTLNYADEIRGSEAGLVVRRDPRELASATLELIGDPGLRKRMGENGLRMAQAYSWQACGEKIDRTIQCVLQGKALPADLTLGE
jgi:glycosyltransferase involved in cell wall biosynthesis